MYDPLPETVSERREPAVVAARQKRSGPHLDTPAMVATHSRLMGHYSTELARQYDNRLMQAKCFDYYDNEQWTPEKAQEMRDRGQDPLVFNVISTTIDWITGTQKRARVDGKVLPRRKEGARAAELKTDLIKYLSDANLLEFHRSRAFGESTIGGVGWLEDQWQDDGGTEPVYSRFESWRNMLWDSSSTEMDLSDARYVFRSKWVDLDVAQAWFPNRKEQLALSASSALDFGTGGLMGDDPMDSAEDEFSGVGNHDTFDHARQRVRLIEAWYRVPTNIPRIKGGQFSGEIADPTSRGQYDEITSGDAVVANRVDMQMRCAIMTEGYLIYENVSPYRHGRYPFTPIWAYRKNSNNLPYGVVRRLIDLQDDVNIRAAKARYIMSTSKTFMEAGAVDDLDEFEEEINRPDSIIVYNPGRKIDYNVDRDLAPGHVELMLQSVQMIQSVGGVTDENRGVQTNAKSGIAIARRQEQGALATAGLFDNLLLALRSQGDKQLSLIEQFYSEEKSFRITNQRGVPSWISINRQDPATGDVLPEDDITRSKSDYVMSEQEWSASVREAKTQKLLELINAIAPSAPEVAMVILDLVVEEMDVANREEIVKRIRALTGMRDPDQPEPTPEQQAMEAKKAAAEDRQVRMQEAEIADKEASAKQKEAAASTAAATARNVLASMAGTNVATQRAALEAALMMISTPAVVPVADVVARESGFVSRGEDEDNAAVDVKAANLEQLAAEGAAMQPEPPPDMMPPDAMPADAPIQPQPPI